MASGMLKMCFNLDLENGYTDVYMYESLLSYTLKVDTLHCMCVIPQLKKQQPSLQFP